MSQKLEKIEEFTELLAVKFKDHAPNMQTERWLQLEVANCLMDSGMKVFCEYPYSKGKDECDVVISGTDLHNPTHWIEIKPFGDEWSYNTPSELNDFKKDIQKLFMEKKSRGSGMFLFLVVADCEEADKKMERMIDAVSGWSIARPATKIISQTLKIFVWQVENYNAEVLITKGIDKL